MRRFATGVRDLFRATLMSELNRTVYDCGTELWSEEDPTAAAAKVAERLATFERLVTDDAGQVIETLEYSKIFDRDRWTGAVEDSLRYGDTAQCRQLLIELQSCIEWAECWYGYVGSFADNALVPAKDGCIQSFGC